MSNTEHIRLSDIVKSTHKSLRAEAKALGPENAWELHCKDSKNLQGYATAMRDLAVNHWDVNAAKGQKVVSRITWIYEACKWYFQDFNNFYKKECYVYENCFHVKSELPPQIVPSVPYKLLDVGSCYNPFEQFDLFEVLPIDIAPADNKVHFCDFLNVTVGHAIIIDKTGAVKQLQEEYFDIVVFSLLLEYLPHPRQRLKCCLKAYSLLKKAGMLAIVTPDSNHVGSNSKIFKSWQYVLAKHGFKRVKYDKLPHMHCMLFRKAQKFEVAARWADVHKSQKFYEELYIPQDISEGKESVIGSIMEVKSSKI